MFNFYHEHVLKLILLWPVLKVPSLKCGDKVLNESYAAIMYLEVKAGQPNFLLAAALCATFTKVDPAMSPTTGPVQITGK